MTQQVRFGFVAILLTLAPLVASAQPLPSPAAPYATGIGRAADRVTNAAQRKALARRAAILDAQRNLTVQHGRSVGPTVLVGARVTMEGWDAALGVYRVRLELPPRGVATTPPIAMDAPASNTEPGVRDPLRERPLGIIQPALILDLRGLHAVPAATFHIYDEVGRLVAAHATARYEPAPPGADPPPWPAPTATDPLRIRATRLAPNRVDVILSTRDAARLAALPIDPFRTGGAIAVID